MIGDLRCKHGNPMGFRHHCHECSDEADAEYNAYLATLDKITEKCCGSCKSWTPYSIHHGECCADVLYPDSIPQQKRKDHMNHDERLSSHDNGATCPCYVLRIIEKEE